MIYVVCHDLGKSYSEVIGMERTFIRWHYINATERQAAELELQFEMLLAVNSPERYKAHRDKKLNEKTNDFYEETTDEQGQKVSTITHEEFTKMVAEIREKRKNEVVVQRMAPGKPIEMAQQQQKPIQQEEITSSLDLEETFFSPDDEDMSFERL